MAFETSTTHTVQRLINPIVSAAIPLLDIVLEPVHIRSLKEAAEYRKFLTKGVKKLEMELEKNSYRESIILVCRYLVCAFMDEMLLLQPWAKTYFWQDKSFAWCFSHKKLANSDFFVLLDHALRMPALNVDVLELGYVCLSLGFQGKYRYLSDGQKHLTAFTDKVYDAIRRRRQEYSRQLFVSMPVMKKKRLLFKLPSKRIILAGIIVFLLGTIGFYYYRLSPLTHSIMQSIQTLKANIKNPE